jgi:hypothetical protein
VANRGLRDTGLNAFQLYQLIQEAAFDPACGSTSSMPAPATAAATAVAQHWLQAFDTGHGEDTDWDHPFKRFQGLTIARRHLVQAHAAKGLAGLLETCPAAVAALQGLLPFLQAPHKLIIQQPSPEQHKQLPQEPQQRSHMHDSSSNSRSAKSTSACSSNAASAPFLQATGSSSIASSSDSRQQLQGVPAGLPSLLELLPPAQQAWLMGDVVAGLLLTHPAADLASSSNSSSSSTTASRKDSSHTRCAFFMWFFIQLLKPTRPIGSLLRSVCK